MFIDWIPNRLTNLLFRSFEAKEGFVQQVEELRRTHPGQPIAFALVGAGLIEFIAVRRFLGERFGPEFEPRYITRLPSIFVEPPSMFLRRVAAALRLGPRVPSRMRLISDELLAGRPVLLNFEIGDRKKLYETPRGEKEIAYLQSNNPKALLVPVCIVWRRRRRLEEAAPKYLSGKALRTIVSPFGSIWNLFLGDPYQPKGLRKLAIMLRQYSKSTLRLGESLPVLGTHPKTLRRKVFSAISQEKKVILGPVYKSTRLVSEDILRSPVFARYVENYSTEQSQPEISVYKKADAYLREMSARYSYFVVEATSWVLSWVFRTIYEEVTFEEEDFVKLRNAAREGPILFLPCHRSYVDFLLLSHLLFQKELNPPHVAAGINLNFWPMGTLFKKGGGFFIRRSFRGNPLYQEVLRRYIAALLNSGVSVEFFIEGARSRTGKLSPPRYGMLKMIADSIVEGAISEKVTVMPVSITYDLMTEGRSHKRELEGGEKVQESALGMVKSTKVLFKNFGKVHVRMGEPLSLNDWMRPFLGEGAHSIEARKLTVQKLAFEVLHRINRVTPVTTIGLVCLVMLAKPGCAQLKSEFEALLLRIHEDMRRLGTLTTQELRQDYLRACRRAVARLLEEGVLEKYHAPSGAVGLRIPHKQRVAALLYKNSAFHAFLDPALAGISKRSMDSILEARTLLRFEYFFAEKEASVKSVLDVPQDVFTSFYAFCIDDNLETIQLGLSALLEMQGLWLAAKDWRTRLMQYGRTKVIEATVSHLESVNTQGFLAFIDMAKNLGLLKASPNNAELFSPASATEIRNTLVRVKALRQNVGSWDNVLSQLGQKALEILPEDETPVST